MQLTDAMIENELRNTVYMSGNPVAVIAVVCAAMLFFGFLFFKTKRTNHKISCALLVLLLFVFVCIFTGRQIGTKHAIQNGEWRVCMDTVDRVMEKTENDRKSYFLVLNGYGRVSLESYEEALQYYAGAKVYVVVLESGDCTGVIYPEDTYVYVGSH